ncbi:hypothetical protein EJB05_28851, partial [Eragrostis curvula]
MCCRSSMGELMINTEDLPHAYVEIFHHCFGHVKSMALRCADGLGIPTAIHRRGGAATVSDLIANMIGLHPSKLPETVYTLTPSSRLLVAAAADDDKAAGSRDMSAMLRLLVRPSTAVSVFFGLEAWFRDGGATTTTTTLFEAAHGGMSPWNLTKEDDSYNKALSDACVADSGFTMDAVLRERGEIFRGLGSLVDVKCRVLDLEQVVSKAPGADGGVVDFVAGDMFESIPSADAVLIKNVLDCWADDDCIKILRQCKKAIPSREAGGKVIIINTVVGYGAQDAIVQETHVLFDIYMMRQGGIEREEHEWKRIFLEAGFSDYKITPILGLQSIVEVAP